VSLIKLNAWKDISHVAIEILPKKKKKKTKLATKNKGTRRKNDSICGQYTNVCKLSAN